MTIGVMTIWHVHVTSLTTSVSTLLFLIEIIFIAFNGLSYDVAVIQWITSCQKNRMTTGVMTIWHVHVTSLTTSVSILRFLIEIIFTAFNGLSYDIAVIQWITSCQKIV